MAEANVGWGAPRIHGELLKLGIEVSERTVSRLMPKPTTAPSQTWRTFLDNHVLDLVSIDFFTVPTARLRVLFVFIVLSQERRRVIHFNITEHPTAAWTAQQIVEAFPEDQAPRYLVRDRDRIYGEYFQHRVQGMGIREVRTAPGSPWQRRVKFKRTSWNESFRSDRLVDSITATNAGRLSHSCPAIGLFGTIRLRFSRVPEGKNAEMLRQIAAFEAKRAGQD